MYAFPRETGQMLFFDTKTKQAQIRDTGIREKIMWVCSNKDKAYILSWNRSSIYCLDLNSFAYEKYDSGISPSDKFKSNSFIPFQGTVCDNDDIYFFDSRKIFRFNIEQKNLTLAYTSPYDIGSRIAVTNDSIIIPPWHKEDFYIINKRSFEIIRTIGFPENINRQLPINMNTTGVPYKTEKSIYFPVAASDKVLCIDTNTLEPLWINLVFDSNNVSRMIRAVVASDNIMLEAPDITLSDFLSELPYVDKKSTCAANGEGKKIYNLVKSLL